MKLFKLSFVLTVLMSMAELQAFAAYDTSTKVQVNGLSYYLDNNNLFAMVTSKNSGEYSGDITIPISFTYQKNKYAVMSIGKGAFQDCSKLTSVTIGDNVRDIGEAAFYGLL